MAFVGIFWCPSIEKFQLAADRTILTIPHLKCYAPNFSGNIWKMSRLWKLGVQAPPKSLYLVLCPSKNCFWGSFWRKSSFWPNEDVHCWKAIDLSFLTIAQNLDFPTCQLSEFWKRFGNTLITLAHSAVCLIQTHRWDLECKFQFDCGSKA